HLHVDFAGEDDGVVDGVGAMVAGRDTGAKLDDTKDGAIGEGGGNLSAGRVAGAIIAHRKAFSGPDDGARLSRAAGGDVSGNFHDQTARPSRPIMAGYNPSPANRHECAPFGIQAAPMPRTCIVAVF